MAITKTQVKACEVLKSRVRLETAVIRQPRMDGSPMIETPEIREALRLYVETWIIPLIDAVQAGDAEKMRRLSR